MTKTYLIPQQNIATLQADFAKLAKKAEKIGCAAPTLTIGETISVKIGNTVHGDELYAQKVQVTVSGEAPKLNGWSFVGVVESVEGSTVLRSIPGQQIPEYYRHADPCNCDHCNVNRRRNSTFIVKSESGEYKQVGKQCLSDFLDHANPEHVAAYAQRIAEFDINSYESDESTGYDKKYLAYSTKSVAAAAIRAIKIFGYQKTDSDCSTRDVVANHLFGSNNQGRLPVEQEDFDSASEAIQWMQQQTGSEFNLNTAAYANGEAVPYKAFGYVVAGAMMFLKTVDVQYAETAKANINNEPIALDGEKIKLNCTVISAHAFNRPAYSYYDSGVSQVLILKTENNQLIKMFTANMDIKEGDVVNVSGKVKEQTTETYEKSAFVGYKITSMAPRTRLQLL